MDPAEILPERRRERVCFSLAPFMVISIISRGSTHSRSTPSTPNTNNNATSTTTTANTRHEIFMELGMQLVAVVEKMVFDP